MPRNILLLVVDCLRADHLSCYGYSKITPNIDLLASKGTLYKNAWSAGSYTSQSIPHILSEYLYYQLRKRGYLAPIVIHSNPIVTRYLDSNKLKYLNIDLHPKSRFKKLKNLFAILSGGTYRGEARANIVNETALKFIKGLGRPFFLCLWYMDVHAPYFPPHKTRMKDILLNRKYLKAVNDVRYKMNEKELRRLVDNYDNEIAYFDRNLSNLLMELNEETTIILTSDHGDEFQEAGDLGHHDKEIPELRHVPLIIKTPHCPSEIIDERFDFKNFDKLICEIINEYEK